MIQQLNNKDSAFIEKAITFLVTEDPKYPKIGISNILKNPTKGIT
jgi:hypothetical protein